MTNIDIDNRGLSTKYKYFSNHKPKSEVNIGYFDQECIQRVVIQIV